MTKRQKLIVVLTTAAAFVGLSAVTALAASDLSILKTVDKTEARPGETLKYVIKVTNNGATSQNDVTVTDKLDPFVTYKAGTSKFATPYTGGQYQSLTDDWIKTGSQGVNLGVIPSGMWAYVVFEAVVNGNAADGYQICNYAFVKSNESPDWIQWSVKTTVKVTGSPRLVVDKKASANGKDFYDNIPAGGQDHPRLFGAGETVAYRIYFRNEGTVAAEGVKIIDRLPTYLDYSGGQGKHKAGKVTFELGRVEAGEDEYVQYSAKVSVDLPTEQRTQENTAEIFEGDALRDSDSALIWIRGPYPIVLAAVEEEKEEEGPPAGEVLGEVKELPKAGASGWVLLELLGMIGAGIGLRRIERLVG